MTQEQQTLTSTKSMLDRGHNFAILGLIISLFAFSISVTTPWLLNHFSPPAPTIEEVAVEKAISIKDRVMQAVSGAKNDTEGEGQEKAKVNPKDTQHWTDYWSFIVILIALGGIVNGAFGSLQQKNRYIGGTAIFFGLAAIIAQYWMIAFGILILVLLIAAILSSFGVEF